MKVEIKTKREEDGLLIDLKNVYLTNDEGVKINLDYYLKELLKRLKRLEEK